MVYSDDPVLVAFVGVASYETDATGIPAYLAAGDLRGDGELFDTGDAERFRLKAVQFARVGGIQDAGPFDDQRIGDLHAQVLVLHKMQLSVNREGADHQDDGGGELDDDE